MGTLIEALEQRRKAEGFSAHDFAPLLGVSEATYSRVRNGKLVPGRQLIRGALRRYPELAMTLALDARAGQTTERVAS